jgi:tubulin-specific chaperone B
VPEQGSLHPAAPPADVIDYVTGTSSGQAQSADTVLLRVAHSNLRAVFPELRLSRSLSVAELKDKLYAHTGTRPALMRVLLLRGGAPPGVALAEDERLLGWYGPAAVGDTLRVVDDDPYSASKGGWLEDVELVEKFVLSDEAYRKRPDNYLAYKERMREADPTWTMTRALEKKRGGKLAEVAEPPPADVAAECRVEVSARVEVRPGGKRGVVRHVGNGLHGLPPGWWIGVEFDEPVGKNDGEVKGVRYFTCGKAHGGFVRPSNTSVGDFPPRDDLSDRDEDEDEDEDEI